MMNPGKLLAAASVGATALVAGCTSLVQPVDCASNQYAGYTRNELFPTSPRLDCAFGEAVDMAVARQIADKDAAAKNANKGAGIDGAAAKEAIDQYRKSFRSPEAPASPFTIGISGSSSSSAAP